MKSEKKIQAEIRLRLLRAGWFTDKSHGNMFQPGWPDLFIHHPQFPFVHWLEIKTPRGRYTSAQLAKFPVWERNGVGIWTCDDPDLVFDVLSSPPNWRDFLTPGDREALEFA